MQVKSCMSYEQVLEMIHRKDTPKMSLSVWAAVIWIIASIYKKDEDMVTDDFVRD